MQLINFTEANCKNCYKCVRACPVKAIRFQDHQAIIDEERCIACGQCFLACPQNARDIQSDLDVVMDARKAGKRMVALIAPSFTGFFENPGGVVDGLRRFGFQEIAEVSLGAQEVTEKYREYVAEMKPKYAISSCCPTVNLLIRRYYKGVAKYLLPSVSPMMATAKALKNKEPDSFTVFISPCLSKKCEPFMFGQEGYVDAVLTMDEMLSLFQEDHLQVESLPYSSPDYYGSTNARSYPVKGAIGEGFHETLSSHGYDVLHVEGILQVREVLEEIEKGALDPSFLELNACHESCISGPCVPKKSWSTYKRKQLVKKHAKEGWNEEPQVLTFEGCDLHYAYKENLFQKKKFTEDEITRTLARMGKTKKKDELDCSACGYDSCREKAAAVLEGMSDVEMCMPFMRTRAEHMNDIIFYNSPNIIFILDEDLCICQMNPSAEKTFEEKSEHLRYMPISVLLPDEGIRRVMDTGKHALNKRISYREHNLVVMQSVIHLPKDNQLLIIMSDITEEERRRKELNLMKEQTVEITGKVIEKQMRVAHEIASLLGETTAETKIALNRLKELVMEDR